MLQKIISFGLILDIGLAGRGEGETTALAKHVQGKKNKQTTSSYTTHPCQRLMY